MAAAAAAIAATLHPAFAQAPPAAASKPAPTPLASPKLSLHLSFRTGSGAELRRRQQQQRKSYRSAATPASGSGFGIVSPFGPRSSWALDPREQQRQQQRHPVLLSAPSGPSRYDLTKLKEARTAARSKVASPSVRSKKDPAGFPGSLGKNE